MTISSSRLWPDSGVTPRTHYELLATNLGASFPLARPLLIGLRGVRPLASETHDIRTNQTYDDAFVLLAPAAEPVVFGGATHPYQLLSSLAPDVNHDGLGDVALIDPGLYRLTFWRRDAASCPLFKLTTSDGKPQIPCLRDTSHDGLPVTPSVATEILFHTGRDAPPGAEHSWSIGCQTTSLPNLNVMLSAGQVIDYRLVTAADAVASMSESEPPAAPAGIA